MNIALIDDEIHCIESLVIELTKLYPEMKIVYKSNNPYQAVQQLPKINIDLVFLDIEMPGMNGFELLENIPHRKFDVIFSTAYSQYALQAFKAKAINYILKPFDETELKEIVDNWMENKDHGRNTTDKIDGVIEHLKKAGIIKNKIAVPLSDGYQFVEVDRIMYCKSQSNYTTLYLENNTKLVVSKTLKKVEQTLANFFFIRVHQSYLINPNFIKRYHKNDGGYLLMNNKKTIPVSRSKRSLIENLFEIISRKNP